MSLICRTSDFNLAHWWFWTNYLKLLFAKRWELRFFWIISITRPWIWAISIVKELATFTRSILLEILRILWTCQGQDRNRWVILQTPKMTYTENYTRRKSYMYRLLRIPNITYADLTHTENYIHRSDKFRPMKIDQWKSTNERKCAQNGLKLD